MNKFMTKVVGICLGLTMAVGIGVAVASNQNAVPVKAASGDVLAEFTGSICSSTTYARYSGNDSHSVAWVGCGSSNGTLGSTKASQHSNIKVGSDDIAASKAVKSDVAANDTGLYFYYTKTALSNVNRITLSGTITGNANATIYAITGNAVSSSSGTAYTQISLKSDSPTKQGDTFTSGVDFTFDTVSSAKYYGIVIVTSSFKKIADGSVKIYEGGSAGSPEVSITSNQFLLPKNNGTTITAQANEYAPAGSTINYAVDNANVALSATTGSSTKLTVSDSVAAATKITLTVTLKNSGGTTLDTKTKSLLVSSKSADSTSEAIIASEAKSLVSTAEIDGKELYVKGFANNSGAKYVWLSDIEDTTKTFEVYNYDGLSSYSDGTFIVAHGNAKKYR